MGHRCDRAQRSSTPRHSPSSVLFIGRLKSRVIVYNGEGVAPAFGADADIVQGRSMHGFREAVMKIKELREELVHVR